MLLRLLASAAALGVATWLLPGISIDQPDALWTVLVMLLVAAVFGVVNAVVKPLFTLVSLPVVLLSLGLFLLVINALMLLLTSWLSGLVGLGWQVDGFGNAFVGALIVSVVSFVLNAFLPERRPRSAEPGRV